MREIEIKLKVPNLKVIENKLKELGVALSAPIRQHDTIYVQTGDASVYETSKEGQIVMRIRRQEGKNEFNLKQQKSNEMDNLEHETKISDPDAVHRILTTIGYAPEVEVKKIRRKGRLGEYEICLDKVEQLGTFVELEKLTDDNADPQQVRAELFSALAPFGLTEKDEETRGYDTQMYQLQHPKNKRFLMRYN